MDILFSVTLLVWRLDLGMMFGMVVCNGESRFIFFRIFSLLASDE